MKKKEKKILEKYFDYVENDYLETWTNGGVDMIIYLDSNKKSIKEIIEEYIDNFDIDEEIDLYREDKRYRENFTIRESLEDFENWLKYLKNVCNELENIQ